MKGPITILGIAGSLRRQSYNRSAYALQRIWARGPMVTTMVRKAGGDHGRLAWKYRDGAGAVSSAPDFRVSEYFPLNQPKVMIGDAPDKCAAEGNLTDERTRDYIRKLLQSLVEWTERIRP